MKERKTLMTWVVEALQGYADQQQQVRRSSQATDRASQRRQLLRWLTPNGGTILLILALVLTQRVWARPLLGDLNAPGGSATTISYQGRLADAEGTPEDGIFGMQFSVWDASTGGNLVWGPEGHTEVSVSDGLFSIGLGSVIAGGIPTTVWQGDRYLEITVAGETLSPRELIRSVPIAGMALTVPDGALESRHVRLDSGRLTPSDSIPELATSWQLIPGMSMTLSPLTDQTYVFYLVVEMVDYGSTGGYGSARLFLDGEAAGAPAFMHWNADLATVAQAYRVDLDPSAHTVEVKAQSSEGGGQIYKSGTSLTWFAVSQ